MDSVCSLNATEHISGKLLINSCRMYHLAAVYVRVKLAFNHSATEAAFTREGEVGKVGTGKLGEGKTISSPNMNLMYGKCSKISNTIKEEQPQFIFSPH